MNTPMALAWLATVFACLVAMPEARAQQVASLASGGTLGMNHYLVSDNKAFFVVQQSDGNLCVYKGSGPNDKRGVVWCHNLTGPAGSYFTALDDKGNLCTYRGAGIGDPQKTRQWCSMANGTGGPFSLAIQDDTGNLCVSPPRGKPSMFGMSSGMFPIWCAFAAGVNRPPAVVAQFAPLLKFDGGSGKYGYPILTDPSNLSGAATSLIADT